MRPSSSAERAADRSDIQGKLGEIAFKRGDIAAATRLTEEALRSLGRFVPRGRALYLPLLAWEAAAQTAHSLAPGLFLHRRGPPPENGTNTKVMTRQS